MISKILRTAAVVANSNANCPDQAARVTETTSASLQINNARLYIPVVTLSINDIIKFLKTIKQTFKRKLSWNKNRSEITTQPQNNNMDYLIDPAFRNINMLFILSFKSNDNDHKRDFFDKYYMPFKKSKILMH